MTTAKTLKVTGLQDNKKEWEIERHLDSYSGEGIKFQATTNVEGVRIVCAGNGETKLEGSWEDIKPFYHMGEFELGSLINEFDNRLDL